MIVEQEQHAMHITLKQLIQAKSQRDNIKFTACQLAKILSIPRSILTKLTHHDVAKRVKNPKIETIMKIVDFFKQDGFDITIEKLLGQKLIIHDVSCMAKIPLYSMHKQKKIGYAEIKILHDQIMHNTANLIGLEAPYDIEPFFKIGSIFIVNNNMDFADQHLIAITIIDNNDIQIKRYCIDNQQIYLQEIDKNANKILLDPLKFKIIGVIIQINAKT